MRREPDVVDEPTDVKAVADHSQRRERTERLLSRLEHADPQERRLIRDQVVDLHLGMAETAARRIGVPPSQHDDLVQVARIGLVEAFDRYDPTRSTTYAYFAWITMNGLLRRHLRDHGWSVRPPRAVQESANVLRAATPFLAQELRRQPTGTEIAEHLGWTLEHLDSARQAELGLHATSIEVFDGDAWMPESPAELDAVETRVLIDQVAHTLTDQEQDLLRMRFVEELTQAQIAAAIGSTQMQVSRLLTRLMAKLRLQIGNLGDTAGDR